MIRFFTFIVSALFCALTVCAQVPEFGTETYVLDFTKSHTGEDFTKSGINYAEDPGRIYGQLLFFSNQKIVIKIPGGRQFEQRVDMGTIKINEGKIVQFETRGLIMPHDQVYEVAKSVLINLGLPLDKLDEWNEQNRGKYPDAANFSISNMALYPAVGISIMTTFSDVYPWSIKLKLSWNSPSRKDWTEERAEKESPPPPAGYETVSLEPPSGKTYDRRDSFPKIRAEQAAHEKKYYEDHPTNAPPKNIQPKALIKTLEVATFETTDENQAFSLTKIILLFAGVVLFIVVLIIFKRKR